MYAGFLHYIQQISHLQTVIFACTNSPLILKVIASLVRSFDCIISEVVVVIQCVTIWTIAKEINTVNMN